MRIPHLLAILFAVGISAQATAFVPSSKYFVAGRPGLAVVNVTLSVTSSPRITEYYRAVRTLPTRRYYVAKKVFSVVNIHNAIEITYGRSKCGRWQLSTNDKLLRLRALAEPHATYVFERGSMNSALQLVKATLLPGITQDNVWLHQGGTPPGRIEANMMQLTNVFRCKPWP